VYTDGKDSDMSDQQQKTTGSSEEWKELFSNIGEQVRKDIARMVGADAEADWPTIGRQTDEAARTGIAKAVGASTDADWESIGQHLDQSARREIGKIVGATDDADWGDIGQAVSDGVESFLKDLFAARKDPAAAPFDAPEDPNAPVDPWKKD